MKTIRIYKAMVIAGFLVAAFMSGCAQNPGMPPQVAMESTGPTGSTGVTPLHNNSTNESVNHPANSTGVRHPINPTSSEHFAQVYALQVTDVVLGGRHTDLGNNCIIFTGNFTIVNGFANASWSPAPATAQQLQLYFAVGAQTQKIASGGSPLSGRLGMTGSPGSNSSYSFFIQLDGNSLPPATNLHIALKLDFAYVGAKPVLATPNASCSVN